MVALPAGVDFGMQQVRVSSSEQMITISPGTGSQNDMVTGVSARCPDFSIRAPNLPAPVSRVCMPVTCTGSVCQLPDGSTANATANLTANATDAVTESVTCQTTSLQTYQFGATFNPTVPGPVSCVVTVTLNNATNRTTTLTGTGVPPPIAADVQPAAVTFGEVRNNTDSTLAVIGVRSSGSQPLDVTSVTASSGFTITSGPTTAYALPANITQDYKLACHPIAVGEMTGQFVVQSTDPAQTRIAVELSCKGIDSALGIAPSPATLATTRVGEPVEAAIELRNTGTAPMTLESVSVVGATMSMSSSMRFPMTLARPTDVASVAVRFDASVPGDASGTLVAKYDGGKIRTTQINGRALSTSLSLVPDGDVDFGPVCVGQSRSREFILIANDQGAFKLSSISNPGPPFSVGTSAPLPVTVLGGGASQFLFSVTAAPQVAGPAQASTAVHTDIPNGADHIVSLDVLGLPAGGVTATPDALDLGSLEVNTTGIGKEVQLSNCATSPIAYSHARIEGPGASDFAIVAEPSGQTIAPNDLATWLIVLRAHAVGPTRATFSVDVDGGTRSVDLLGEGLPGANRPGSYYACSTGRPAALWPIALALIGLRRRRARRA
ncbi:MAG TPA: choice-of-anchor D domain-containing protein [Kofleriaceae bacterium]